MNNMQVPHLHRDSTKRQRIIRNLFLINYKPFELKYLIQRLEFKTELREAEKFSSSWRAFGLANLTLQRSYRSYTRMNYSFNLYRL
jgi:hypothetical protein